MHSPSIAKLEIVTRGHVRRAKLYYLRELRGKKARIKERRLDEAKLAALARGEAAHRRATSMLRMPTTEDARAGGLRGTPEASDENSGRRRCRTTEVADAAEAEEQG